jgi:hypothetical protein
MTFPTHLLVDLAPFADLGAEPPSLVQSGNLQIVRLFREGRPVDLLFYPNGSVKEQGENNRLHSSFRALLASPSFGDLGRWADAQKIVLKSIGTNLIPVHGTTENGENIEINEIDKLALFAEKEKKLRILVLDGPAGIGKTHAIRKLALSRASNYRQHQLPLILHVESRGRMLQNLTDLMAFGLQTLRSSVTYDQVPVLIRHGLVALAIDGFDELSDPNGYELAWSQLNELVSDVRGNSTLILAGRDTFISKTRVLSALNAIRTDTDVLANLTLQPIPPETAKNWLKEYGSWTDSLLLLESVQPLFEQGSPALRPFFLRELEREEVRDQLEGGQIDELTWFLVDRMVTREATKFGKELESVTTEKSRIEFVFRFLSEVARDMADNQTEAIPGDTLVWLADMVCSDLKFPQELTGILKNRAGVISFLTQDLRQGYLKFSHSEIFHHFLARVTINTVSSGEVPKFVRRNIVGADFLSSFVRVAAKTERNSLAQFFRTATNKISTLGDIDRTRRNLAALVLAISDISEIADGLSLSDVTIDEALLSGTISYVSWRNVSIAQLDVRGADLRNLKMENCYIQSLIADSGTLLENCFSTPQRIQLRNQVLAEREKVLEWLGEKFSKSSANSFSPEDARNKPLFRLFERVVRYKSYWIRNDGDRAPRKILEDEDWPLLRELLERHQLLQVCQDRQASGGPGAFFHVRRREELLEEANDPTIQLFIKELISACLP